MILLYANALDTWPGRRLSRWRLISSFPQFLQENTDVVPRLGHDRFLPSPFQLVTYNSALIFHTETIVK
jgi:hypothetical protein